MARTVAGNTITQALIDAQNSASRTPYIRIYINSTDYFSRLLYLEHYEEAYRDRAVIGLSNRDGTLDAVDLDGYEFEIAYGLITGNAVAEPLGNNDTAEYTYTATLWVKSHQIISVGGERIYQIYAEGMWSGLRELRVLPGLLVWKASVAVKENQIIHPTTPNGHSYKCTTAGTTAASEPTWPTVSEDTVADNTVTWTEDGGNIAVSSKFNATHTVEELIKLTIESMGWTWTTITGDTDGIIDAFSPIFWVNKLPFETAAAILYRLIWMTKHYLRPKKSKTFEAVFPQSDDTADVTYYTTQAPYFIDYIEKEGLLIPNSIVVVANQDPDTGGWNTADYPLIVGTAKDNAQIAAYREVVEPYFAGNIQSQANADNRASAILARLQAERLSGQLLINHDSRLELFDKVAISDSRKGSAISWPSDAMARISTLLHKYARKTNEYTLAVTLGEVSADFGIPNWSIMQNARGASEGKVKDEETVNEFISDVTKPPSPPPPIFTLGDPSRPIDAWERIPNYPMPAYTKLQSVGAAGMMADREFYEYALLKAIKAEESPLHLLPQRYVDMLWEQQKQWAYMRQQEKEWTK